MKIVKPEYYKNFKCIAGACPDSCCQGWEVDADSESLEYYSKLSGDLEIKQRIDRVLSKDEFGNTVFTLAPKKRCPFLNDENLCDMHIAIGQEHTPYTCRTFPRFIYDYGSTREIGLSFSCPVAADMIYALDSHLKFDEEVNDELPTINDIDAMLFYKLNAARREVMAILQSDSFTVSEKLIKILDYGYELQNEIDSYTCTSENLDFFDVFNNPELINREWEEKIKNGQIRQIENSVFNENTAVYFIYKYFLQAVYDRDILSKIKMAVVGVLINTYFGGDAWTIHLWSKETEHSQYNMDRYKKLLKTEKCLSVGELKRRINPNV